MYRLQTGIPSDAHQRVVRPLHVRVCDTVASSPKPRRLEITMKKMLVLAAMLALFGLGMSGCSGCDGCGETSECGSCR